MTLDTSLLTSEPVVGWSLGHDPGSYEAFLDLGDTARTFTVTHTEGATASVEIPSYEASF